MMDKESQRMWQELKTIELFERIKSNRIKDKIVEHHNCRNRIANKCHHVFPFTAVGEKLKPCQKCGISPALMPPSDTWERE